MIPVQKQNDCWWFGKTGKCYNFYILMAFVSICTVTDIACLFLLGWSADTEAGNSGGTAEDTSGGKWKHRCAVVVSCLPLKTDSAHLLSCLAFPQALEFSLANNRKTLFHCAHYHNHGS
jgi:hypothetical protein